MARPKDIGTKAESAVTRFAQEFGYPFADRQPLRGNKDQGDVLFCPGFIGEVKGGDTARKASDNQILSWLVETTVERDNADADMAILVVARWRQPTRRWWGVMWADDVVNLASQNSEPAAHSLAIPVRFLLADALALTRGAGWGDELEFGYALDRSEAS